MGGKVEADEMESALALKMEKLECEKDALKAQLKDAEESVQEAEKEAERQAQLNQSKHEQFVANEQEMADLRATNAELVEKVEAFDQTKEDLCIQHKLNEKKNLKHIRELKSQLLKSVEQYKMLEAECRAKSESAPEQDNNT